MRVAYVDWTQFGCVQSKGAWSKVLCKQPSKEMQKDIGQKLMILPFSPINGTILIVFFHPAASPRASVRECREKSW